MDLKTSVDVSASGLRAQALRMRVIAENLANADSLATTPGGAPYRRRVVTFQSALEGGDDKGAVEIRGIEGDKSSFQRVYQPGNPAADAAGYLLKPNVNSLVEVADMKTAQRSYEANLNAIEAARSLTMRTIDLLK